MPFDVDGAVEETRRRIMALLQQQQGATVQGIAESLELASASIRRHLDILQRDHLVSYRVKRQRTGRPEHVFSLTEAGQESLPKNYEGLLYRLLKELSQLQTAPSNPQPHGLLNLMLSRLAQQMLLPCQGRWEGKPLHERLAALQDLLEAEYFAPETQALDDALSIHLLNCPFRSVALEVPAVCALDARLIETVLQRPVQRTHCINHGDSHCTYAASPSPVGKV